MAKRNDKNAALRRIGKCFVEARERRRNNPHCPIADELEERAERMVVSVANGRVQRSSPGKIQRVAPGARAG